jgi:hypothetical protein
MDVADSGSQVGVVLSAVSRGECRRSGPRVSGSMRRGGSEWCAWGPLVRVFCLRVLGRLAFWARSWQLARWVRGSRALALLALSRINF